MRLKSEPPKADRSVNSLVHQSDVILVHEYVMSSSVYKKVGKQNFPTVLEGCIQQKMNLLNK